MQGRLEKSIGTFFSLIDDFFKSQAIKNTMKSERKKIEKLTATWNASENRSLEDKFIFLPM